MERDYLEAAIPERYRLLGCPLLPFSLGHLTLLRWLGNAYVLPSGNAGPGDLIQGIYICARNYEKALRDLHAPALHFRLRLWGWACGRRWSVSEKMRVFERYIQDGSKPPDLHEPDSDGRNPGAPLIHRVRLRIMSHLGLTFAEAMNYPWRLALHDYFASYEAEDRAKILNPSEAESIDEHEKLWEQVSARFNPDQLAGLMGGQP